MELIVRRKWLDDLATVGELYREGHFFCYTLEDKVRQEKVPGKTAIPEGRYPLTLTLSQRFGRVMPLINNVPNFSGVRIHTGNRPEDTEGCLLVGDRRGEDAVWSSGTAYDRLVWVIKAAVEAGEEVWITYERAEDVEDNRTSTS